MPSRKVKNQITAKSQAGQELPAMWSEDQARHYFESRRWPNGPVCVHCQSADVYRLQGESTRPGLLECRSCRKQFTVTVGTVMEDSHLPLKVWAMAFHFMTTAKKGMSALQMQRNLGLGSYRTAWFLCHRIREAMRYEPVSGMLKGQVQADETYVGGKPRFGDGKIHKQGVSTKVPVLVLVETNGNAVSQPMQTVTAKTLRSAMEEIIDPSAQIITDEHPAYPNATANFAGGHDTVNHAAGQYAKKKPVLGGKDADGNDVVGHIETVTTNTAESFFALIKRGHYGIYHKMGKQHLHRYCDEFDFRWNGRKLSDVARRDQAVAGAEGKRLMYKSPISAALVR